MVCCLIVVGCLSAEKHEQARLGMTSGEVLALLGEPDTKARSAKQAPPEHYFGPKPSATYLELPEGSPVEIWSYRRFRETWTYVFSLEDPMPVLVNKGYHHPAIKY